MKVQIDVHRTTMGGIRWYKPWRMVWINNKIRKNVSSYSNYVRFIWLKADITLEWDR